MIALTGHLIRPREPTSRISATGVSPALLKPLPARSSRSKRCIPPRGRRRSGSQPGEGLISCFSLNQDQRTVLTESPVRLVPGSIRACGLQPCNGDAPGDQPGSFGLSTSMLRTLPRWFSTPESHRCSSPTCDIRHAIHQARCKRFASFPSVRRGKPRTLGASQASPGGRPDP